MNKKILFYLQPQTIRGNPKAFEWIFLQYRGLAAKLGRSGVVSAFLVDDVLKREFATAAQDVYTPADLGMKFDANDWPASWEHILTDPDMPGKTELLETLWKSYPFEIVFCWNYDATLDRFCQERGVITIYQEQGMIRSPMLFQMDFEGVLWKSSLQRVYEKLKNRVQVNDSALDAFLGRFKAGVTHSREEVVAALNLDRAKPIVLIALQVEDDSNIIVGSPFRRMADFVSFCCHSIGDIADYNVIIKKHPVQPDVALAGVEGQAGLYKELGNLSLINASDCLITINSSMGFEALCLGKKVFTLGKSPYCGLGFTADLDGRGKYRIADYDSFFYNVQTNAAELRRFLYFALFHYQLAFDQAFDSQFYLGLLGRLDEIQDRDKIYLHIGEMEFIRQRNEQEALLAAREEDLAQLKRQLAELAADREDMKRQSAQLIWDKAQLSQQVTQLAADREDMRRQVTQLVWDKAQLSQQVDQLAAAKKAQEEEFNLVYQSTTWRFVSACWRLRDKLFPASTQRRRLYDRFVGNWKPPREGD